MKSTRRTARETPVVRFHDGAGFATFADAASGVRVIIVPKNLMAKTSREKTEYPKGGKCVAFAMLEKFKGRTDCCENFFAKKIKNA
jgi:hypothetical protein